MNKQRSKFLPQLSDLASSGAFQTVVEQTAYARFLTTEILVTHVSALAGDTKKESDEKNFRDSLKILGLAASIAANMDFDNSLRPVIAQISSEIQESVYVGVLYKSDLIVIDRFCIPDAEELSYEVGDCIPAKALAMGRLLIAYLTMSQNFQDLNELASQSETCARLSRREVEEIIELGYCADFGELGGRCSGLAVPIWYPGENPSVALGVTGPSARLLESTMQDYKVLLSDNAQIISANLRKSFRNGL